MPAALVLPISGPYTGTWNGYSLGAMNDDGFVLSGQYTGQEVNQTDIYGMTLVEAIYRGINWRIRIRGIEFNRPGMLAAIQAFGSSGAPTTTFTPVMNGAQIGAIGDRYSKFAAALVLTAVLGNPPTMPTTLTAAGAIAAPNSNVEYLMTSKVREAPFEFVLLPYLAVIGSLLIDTSFTTT